MSDNAELAPPSPDMIGEVRSDSAVDRVFLLECRLEQMRANLDEARTEAHRVRARLADTTAREADHARRHQRLHEELVVAREEIGSLHHRLEHSEALRAELEGRLFESRTPMDAEELVHLRGEVVAARDLTVARQRTVADLRARVEGLVASRETLLTRVAEWQCAARAGDTDAIDLADFIAALRHDILELELRAEKAERRETDLRSQLRQADKQGHINLGHPDSTDAEEDSAASAPTAVGNPAKTNLNGGVPPAARDDIGNVPAGAPGQLVAGATALVAGDDTESRIDALLRLGRSREAEAFYAIRSWLVASEPRVRAAAYQALGQFLERQPSRLEPHIRWGIADADPRVRRRVVLAAAAARGLDLRTLLDSLRRDPNPQVRRVVQEVLRRPPPAPASAAGTGVTDSEDIEYGVAS